jgi:hypothetical protein
VLDKVVEEQFHTLLGYYKYDTQLSIEIPMHPTRDSESERIEVIRQSRQCISIGSVIYGEELVRVWMVRPTINYTTYVIETLEGMRNTLANSYVMRFRSIGNYTQYEVSIQCPTKEPNLIRISGTMAHYYIMRCGLDIKLQHVSIGGSLLRAHQIRDLEHLLR